MTSPQQTLFDHPLPRLSRLEREFMEFDLANPEVWSLFCHFAQEALDAGHARLSADAILHRIRWETSVVTRGGRGYRINDHHSCSYARKYERCFPMRAGVFEMRKRRGVKEVAA